ncbi:MULTISPECIES: tryptophan synthase subunit beta [unclassified Pseudomonas]|uniref:tryptophan synthase subunit beta n=1 Tax=unclassified Pseudomonas TaxID=196821 RepID=UPI000BC8FD50|nr:MULTISPECIES: tryptophan synthase subunit beta [unclassified Pseudomonas]PVZ15297.1 hypothetical protein F474_02072 [Pseudomonas sp. URIL14HWK12:I12]PVZ24671.1 hypothetical protein F470_01727 [Pseudomonas sp. URIL14HWK12:I10]PVZ34516.1 hypothetical protein F472_02072 [Pseudomonas sp. URIL14HWK12:I11]SNZ08524.1 hypothetical protein SAMN05660463_01060 [Pseudomonas sp. URIL14HWK12:I9]
MFYVQRDEHGKLSRVEAEAFAEATDTLPADNVEIQEWFTSQTAVRSLEQLRQSDLEMIRVLDDLIQLLVEKGVITVTDLPQAALAKLTGRTQARESLGSASARLINDEEAPLI